MTLHGEVTRNRAESTNRARCARESSRSSVAPAYPAAVSAAHDVMSTYGSAIDHFLGVHEAELIEFRRDLHSRPELSGQEYLTTAAVGRRLREAGLRPEPLRVGTGLTCDVGGVGGPVVALRADLDALAMKDGSHTAYRSEFDGVAHSCGHDVHTTIVLGAGLLLHQLLGEAQATVRLIFEPSEEEVPGGAVDVIEEGRLKDVQAIFALHCDPKLDAGLVGTRSGPITSAADLVEITLTGPGGHTARPHLTVDLLAVAGRLLTQLSDEVAAHAADVGPLSLVFGAVHGGDAANVIPAEVLLRASLRTPNPHAWMRAPAIIEAAVHALVDASGAVVTVKHRRGVPPVDNDAAATALLEEAAIAALGEGCLREADHSLGGDSFAWYAKQTQGSYARLGVHDPRAGAARKDLHSADFDVDERSIGYGVRLLVVAALTAIKTIEN